METSQVRILVVDDYEPFRQFICSTLRKRPELQIVGEVSDGLEAVYKAEELQPDLIVLDIGLPSLNGIEAGRRIRKVCPKSKILFVSQESSADVVKEVLSLGARGYLVKAHAGNELLGALETVLEGRQFISSGVAGDYFTPASDSKSLDGLCGNKACPSIAFEKTEFTRNHEVEFYSDDAAFVVGFARFIEAALEAGKAVIVVVTDSHRRSLFQRLQEHGVDIVATVEQGRYVPVDVAETLAAFMANDLADPIRFSRVASDLIASAAPATFGWAGCNLWGMWVNPVVARQRRCGYSGGTTL